MRYATTPRWVYIMLVVMGLCFDAGAIAFYLFVPAPAGAIVGTIWLVVFSGMIFFSLRALAGRRDEERLRREGTAATATLLDAKTTGWVVNNVPQWALRLRIDGYGAPYETTLKLQTYTPPPNGATLTVRVDPLKRDHVVLADDATAAPASAGSATASGSDQAPRLQAALMAALRQAGLADAGTTATTNADGSRTITTTVDVDSNAPGDAGAPRDAAETVRLLGDLERMRASGALGQSEFETIKRRLLGES